MAIKDIIAAGIGFNPGHVKFIVTRGLSLGIAANPTPWILQAAQAYTAGIVKADSYTAGTVKAQGH